MHPEHAMHAYAPPRKSPILVGIGMGLIAGGFVGLYYALRPEHVIPIDATTALHSNAAPQGTLA